MDKLSRTRILDANDLLDAIEEAEYLARKKSDEEQENRKRTRGPAGKR